MTSDYLEDLGVPWASRDDEAKLRSLVAREEPFVLNLDGRDGGGTHWVACRVLRGRGFYADPFGSGLGGYPPRFLASLAKAWTVSRVQFQRLETELCGYYAARFCAALRDVGPGTSLSDFEAGLADSLR